MLVVELLGATTTLLYGINILFDPVHEVLPMDPENPGLTQVSFCPFTPLKMVAALNPNLSFSAASSSMPSPKHIFISSD